MTANQFAKKSTSPLTKSLIAFLLLLIPLYFQVAWIMAFNSAPDQKARLENFYNYMPSIIADARIITILGLVCCASVFIISSKSLSVKSLGWRIFHVVALVISLILLLLNLFQFN